MNNKLLRVGKYNLVFNDILGINISDFDIYRSKGLPAHMLKRHGSLTLCLPLDFHNPLQHSPLRLIFLSNFKIFLVIVCHCVV